MAALDGSLTADRLAAIWFSAPPDEPLEDIQEAVEAFYRRSEDRPEKSESCGPMAYTFGADAGAIVASFQKTYGIDLTTAKMHWWRFCDLLDGLILHSFQERVQFRLADVGKIKNGEARSRASRMKRLYALDDMGQPVREETPMTLEEYNAWLIGGGKHGGKK